MARITRKWNAVGIAATVVVAIAGCGSSGGKSDANDLSVIDVMAPVVITNSPAADGEMHQAVEKLVGKKLNITWVANADYKDKTNVVLASDKIPEAMVVQGKVPGFIKSAQAGAFWDLTDKIDKLANLKGMDPQIRRNASINGRLYGIPRLRDTMRTAVIVRKDWLDKLGLKVPETTDDLYNLAKAFTENDPDGNGKKDTYGLIVPKWPAGYGSGSPYDVVETWFGAPNKWGERDGKLVAGFDTPGFLQGERYLKKLFDEHLVNPDFATLDSGKWEDPFVNGKGGIIIDTSSRALHILSTMKQKDPQNYPKYVTVAGNLLGPDGQRHSYPTAGFSGFISVSKQSVPTESELDDVLQVLDKLASPAGQALLNLGVEGKTYTRSGDQVTMQAGTDAAFKTLKDDLGSFGQIGTIGIPVPPVGEPERALDTLRRQIHASDAKSAVNDPTLALVSETYAAKGAQLDLIVSDARVKYFAGQLDENGLKAQIQLWHSQGGDQIVDEMNELYAKYK